MKFSNFKFWQSQKSSDNENRVQTAINPWYIYVSQTWISCAIYIYTYIHKVVMQRFNDCWTPGRLPLRDCTARRANVVVQCDVRVSIQNKKQHRILSSQGTEQCHDLPLDPEEVDKPEKNSNAFWSPSESRGTCGSIWTVCLASPGKPDRRQVLGDHESSESLIPCTGLLSRFDLGFARGSEQNRLWETGTERN